MVNKTIKNAKDNMKRVNFFSYYIIVKVKVLGCSFDDTNPSCAMKFRTNITVPTYSIALFSSQSVGLYKITDVTSISK